MPLDAANPELWHGATVDALRDRAVYANLCNRDYEGEIKGQGDVVRMVTLSDPTVRTYTKETTTIVSPQYLTLADQALVIDQLFYVNVMLGDAVDVVQQKPKLRNAHIKGIAYQLADNLDTNIAAVMVADGDGFSTAGGTGNRLADTTIVSTDENAYTVLVDLAVKLDEDNIPEEGRWVVVPPWFRGGMVKDARFIEYGTPSNVSVLKSGPRAISRAAGFDIYVSNNVPSTATTLADIIAGHRMAMTCAEQIPMTGLKFFEPQDRFGEAVKVLHVFGRKVIRPTALAMVRAENG